MEYYKDKKKKSKNKNIVTKQPELLNCKGIAGNPPAYKKSDERPVTIINQISDHMSKGERSWAQFAVIGAMLTVVRSVLYGSLPETIKF
ncbi:hypothetical protein A3Q56_03700 [Intoshia linei]|uniref:Uncharacterized protein n=1 Tax=Intoshia linei TaxID=1819745 RepID=A0A177B4Q9_9BILA|nr:hypothetical protein A3Q56_03700 [Intoshia linei]